MVFCLFVSHNGSTTALHHPHRTTTTHKISRVTHWYFHARSAPSNVPKGDVLRCAGLSACKMPRTLANSSARACSSGASKMDCRPSVLPFLSLLFRISFLTASTTHNLFAITFTVQSDSEMYPTLRLTARSAASSESGWFKRRRLGLQYLVRQNWSHFQPHWCRNQTTTSGTRLRSRVAIGQASESASGQAAQSGYLFGGGREDTSLTTA